MTPGPGIARTPLPKGFSAAGINCGVRKYRPDLGWILSDRDCVAAGVFTQNECRGAPVVYSEGILPSRHVRAVVTNSGQANTATGQQGREDNWKMVLATAHAAGCLPHQVLTASTGVIGVPLAIDKIADAIPKLADRSCYTAELFALSILTTDLVPKTVTANVQLSTGTAMITGICKGSGMIHPNMATMLGYVLTDAELTVEFAQPLLKEAADLSFNMISVDGETSTNDSVFLLANGASGVKTTSPEDQAAFKAALIDVMKYLAQSIARDGEGATKLVAVNLRRAPTLALARQAARGVTISPLVKSAIHGEDPNWGRILARLGAEKIPAHCLEKMSLSIQDTPLFADGKPLAFDRLAVSRSLKKDTVQITIDLDSGEFDATAWGCDLSKQYVDINAEYPT